MRKEPRWLSKAVLLAIHERLLAEHGGPAGTLDEGRLEAALDSPKNQFAYGKADIFRLAAAYAHALTRDHPFRDGNKRVALTAAARFLELNGYRLEANEQEAVSAIIALSTNAWMRRNSRAGCGPTRHACRGRGVPRNDAIPAVGSRASADVAGRTMRRA